MDLHVRIRLSEKSHTEGAKVSPQEEIEGVKCIGASSSMCLVVLSTKLAIRRELHSTVIE